MRVDNVDHNKKIGYIKFNTNAEIDLINESMDRLIAKQQKLADREVGGRGRRIKKDKGEIERLERFKQSKVSVIEKPRQNRVQVRAITEKIKNKVKKEHKGFRPGFGEELDVEDTKEFKQAAKLIAESEIGSGLRQGTEVTHRDMHVLVNALNDHIWEMEKNGLNKKTRRNEQKYTKLQNLLQHAQQQKAQFERVTTRVKPRGFGRLRK